MSTTSQINELLDDETQLNRQIEIVSELNENILHSEVLYDIVRTFLSYAKLVNNPFNNAIDIVGTGGDGKSTLNYSTLSAYAVSASGYPVIKHGNKSATSKCGSFDFLERLGEKIPKTVSEAEQQLKEFHRVFLFAPYFHPIFKNVIEVRKHFAQMGQKTIFNILGPLLNPARPKRMLVGVYQEELIEPFSETLSALGVEYACVVYGNGFDEFSICGTSTYCKIENGKFTRLDFNPKDYGYNLAQEKELYAGNAEQNFNESKALFTNQLHGPKKDMLEINVNFALAIADGFSKPLEQYIEISRNTINEKLQHLFEEIH